MIAAPFKATNVSHIHTAKKNGMPAPPQEDRMRRYLPCFRRRIMTQLPSGISAADACTHDPVHCNTTAPPRYDSCPPRQHTAFIPDETCNGTETHDATHPPNGPLSARKPNQSPPHRQVNRYRNRFVQPTPSGSRPHRSAFSEPAAQVPQHRRSLRNAPRRRQDYPKLHFLSYLCRTSARNGLRYGQG